MKTRWAVLAVVLFAVVAATYKPAAAAHVATLDPYPVPTTLVDAGVRLAEAGPIDVQTVSESVAIQAAADAAGSLGDLGKPFSAQLARLTDLNYRAPDGSLVLDNELVWLIRFTGTPQPLYGGVDPKTGVAMASLVPSDEVADELNVVIDAATGVYLEAFSFR